jgi:hypothetical protein
MPVSQKFIQHKSPSLYEYKDIKKQEEVSLLKVGDLIVSGSYLMYVI